MKPRQYDMVFYTLTALGAGGSLVSNGGQGWAVLR